MNAKKQIIDADAIRKHMEEAAERDAALQQAADKALRELREAAEKMDKLIRNPPK